MLKRFQSYTMFTALTLSTVFASADAAQQGTTSTKQEAPVQLLLPTEPCPANWRISGTYLYMLPTLDDTFFVIDGPVGATVPSGTRRNNDFGFNSGFRVGAEYANCEDNRTLQAFYSRLSTHHNYTVSGTNLWATVGNPGLSGGFDNYTGTASSNLNLLYQRLDLNLSQQFVDAKGFYFSIQPGVELAYLRLHEKYNFTNTVVPSVGTINQKSKVEGVGPQLGLSMDYSLYQGSISEKVSHALTFNSLASGSLLMSYSKARESDILDGASVINVHDAKSWRVVPALHARVGLDYIMMGSSVGFSVGVGYEFNSYIRGLNRVVFPDDVADGLSFNSYDNFDVQGLNVTASLSF